MTAPAARRALVAGGGIAGLAAARALAVAGVAVTVVEPGNLGGKLRTSPFAGRMVDEAADTFLARVPGAVELAREVGLAGDLTPPAEVPAFLLGDDGSLHPIPSEQLLGVPTDLDALAATGICSPAGLARAAEDLGAAAGPPPDGDVSIGEVVRARLGDEIHERLVDPLIGGINAGDTDHLSLATVAPQIDAAARSGEPSLIRAAAALRRRAASAGSGPMFLTPRAGMAALATAVVGDLVARGADVRGGVGLLSVEPHPDGRRWRAVVSDGDRDGPVDVDALVLATPAPVTARLLSGVAPAAAGPLADVEHASVALVTLSFAPDDVELPLAGSGFLVPRRAGLLTTACSWTSTKWPHLAPECGDGTVVMRVSAGRIDDRRIADLDDDALADAIVVELGHTSGVTGAPRAIRVSRWPEAFPQYEVGHAERIRAVTAELAGRAPGIALAGAALAGVGVPACIRSGNAAAAGLVERLGAPAAGHAWEPGGSGGARCTGGSPGAASPSPASPS